MGRAFFTSISTNYLDKALALVVSVFEHYPDGHMYISVLNFRVLSDTALDRLKQLEGIYEAKGQNLFFVDPLQLYDDSDLFVYKYNVIEACTAVKPAVALMLLERYSQVTYFDPDIIIYNPLPEDAVFGNSWDFQVTPHVLSPLIKKGGVSEQLFLNFGVFNLGYFSVRDTQSAKQFLEWWKIFCTNNSIIAPHLGLFVDQKPVDLVGCFVDRLSVLRHPGCNMAWWNMFCDGRELLVGQVVSYRNQLEKLYFFHFSNLDNSDVANSRLIAKPLGPLRDVSDSGFDVRLIANPGVAELFEDYRTRLTSTDFSSFASETSFDTTAKGTKIRVFIRMMFWEASFRGMQSNGSPFDKSQFLVFLGCFLYIIRRFSYRDMQLFMGVVKQLIESVLRISLTKQES